MPKFIQDLLKKAKRSAKLIVGLLKEHCRLNQDMSNLSLTENAMGSFWQTQNRGIAAHFIVIKGSTNALADSIQT